MKMAIVGYARCSSVSQSLAVQLDVLNDYGVDVVYSEKQSATSTNQRHELKRCLDYVRSGDTLVITKLDRLARSTFDLTNIAKQLEEAARKDKKSKLFRKRTILNLLARITLF